MHPQNIPESSVESKEHWEQVYTTKAADSVSWFQERADSSLRLLQRTGASLSASIIDVGGGASTLIDDLLSNGYTNLTVLDISAQALSVAKNRLGSRASNIHWIEANITKTSLPAHSFDIWHDRAVFHFLTSAGDRAAYIQAVLKAVKPGGHVIIATFAEDGPTQCSGLPVMRYSAEDLRSEFGESFLLLHHEKELHHTPSGQIQQFVYCHFRIL